MRLTHVDCIWFIVILGWLNLIQTFYKDHQLSSWILKSEPVNAHFILHLFIIIFPKLWKKSLNSIVNSWWVESCWWENFRINFIMVMIRKFNKWWKTKKMAKVSLNWKRGNMVISSSYYSFIIFFFPFKRFKKCEKKRKETHKSLPDSSQKISLSTSLLLTTSLLQVSILQPPSYVSLDARWQQCNSPMSTTIVTKHRLAKHIVASYSRSLSVMFNWQVVASFLGCRSTSRVELT